MKVPCPYWVIHFGFLHGNVPLMCPSSWMPSAILCMLSAHLLLWNLTWEKLKKDERIWGWKMPRVKHLYILAKSWFLLHCGWLLVPERWNAAPRFPNRVWTTPNPNTGLCWHKGQLLSLGSNLQDVSGSSREYLPGLVYRSWEYGLSSTQSCLPSHQFCEN